jgi:hypothetical protein
MLSSTNVPTADGWPNEDIFIATMEERQTEWTNEITINHPLYYYYKENGLIEQASDIGAYVPVKIVARANSTVKDFAAYEDVDLTPQDALDEAKFGYGYTVGTQMYSYQEVTVANSKNAIIDLVRAKEEQLMETMQNHFGGKIIGTQDADGRSIMGIGRIMAYDQSCGGIDPTAAGYGYWNPQRGLKPAGTQYALATELRAGMRRLERLCTYNFEVPSLWLMGEDVYDAMVAYLESKAGFLNPTDMKKQKEWTDFNMAADQKGRTYIYDASLGSKDAWLINTKRTKIRVHTGTYFAFQPWMRMEKKVAKKRECLLAASVYTKRRNANGYITFT